MAYYIDLFSPDTYETFKNSDRTISGFRERQRGVASDIQPGDKLICYVTKLSRWVGVLEVKSTYFQDDKPIFYPVNDPQFDSTSSHSDESFNILRDYLRSHPPIKLRFEKFSEKAGQWWKRHQGTARYQGVANLQKKISFYSRNENDEWVYH